MKDMDEIDAPRVVCEPRVADDASVKSFFSVKISKRKLHPSPPHRTPDCLGVIQRLAVETHRQNQRLSASTGHRGASGMVLVVATAASTLGNDVSALITSIGTAL